MVGCGIRAVAEMLGLLRRHRRAVFVSKFSANVGPKLFQNDRRGVVRNLAAPYAGSVRQGLVGMGMITVG